jgi:hypothetical protein
VAFINGVFRKDGTVFTELRRVDEGKRAALMSTTGDAQFYNVRIDPTSGPVIEFLPVPSSGTYRVQYITEHPGFSADGDTWYGPARSDELIVLIAAMKGLRKEGQVSDANALQAEYQDLLMHVITTANWVDLRNSATIRDVNPLSPTRDPFDWDVTRGFDY